MPLQNIGDGNDVVPEQLLHGGEHEDDDYHQGRIRSRLETIAERDDGLLPRENMFHHVCEQDLHRPKGPM